MASLKASIFFLPVHWSQQGPAEEPRQLYVTKFYAQALIGLIGAYLSAIFKMDDIVCQDVPTCNNYSKLEWSFSKAEAESIMSGWTSKGRAAMALSAGLHIFSSFLFTQLFIFGGIMCETYYRCQSRVFMERMASWVPFIGRVFNVLYCAAHCTLASIIVGGEPSSSGPVAVGILIILALILLIVCALFLIVSLVWFLINCCVSPKSRAASTSGTNTELTASLTIKHENSHPIVV